MRVMLATAIQSTPYIAPLLSVGHRVVGHASTAAALVPQVHVERPDVLLIILPFDGDVVIETLGTLAIPIVLLATEATTATEYEAHATVLPLAAGWEVIGQAITVAGTRAQTAEISSPAATISEAEPAAPPAKRLTPAPAVPVIAVPRMAAPAFQPCLLCPALGGVGVSTLATTLAAAGTEVGLNSLLISSDPRALAVRFALSLEDHAIPRAVDTHLTVVQVSAARWVPERAYDLAVWDLWHSGYSAGQTGAVVIVTRPTGEGRLATVQAASGIRRLGGDLRGVVLVGRGTLEPRAFSARCADYGITLPVLGVIPDDAQVYTLDETQGHALGSARYGPAARTLARALWPDLAWPTEDDSKDATGTAQSPKNVRELLSSLVEITD